MNNITWLLINYISNIKVKCRFTLINKTNITIYRFIISEKGSFEKTSTLTLTNVRTEDSGQYMCVALNPAGKVEANFTLQVFIK